MSVKFARVGIVVFCATVAACGADSPSPSIHVTTPTAADPQPPPPPPQQLPTTARVRIDGNLTLTRIGETSQLTAFADRSDGTSRDVTSEGRWVSGDSQIAQISQTGLLTVVNYGTTSVQFGYETAFSSRTLVATPPGTIVVHGRAREPGMSGLPDVRVTEVASGRVTTTNKDGLFSMGALSGPTARLKFEKDGFEPGQVEITPATPGDPSGVDMAIQRVIRLSPDQTVNPSPLAPNDLIYTVDGKVCDPCRIVRITAPRAGTVHLNVSWLNPTLRLTLLYAGQTFGSDSTSLTADIPIAAAGEVLMYLGVVGQQYTLGHTPFTIAETFR